MRHLYLTILLLSIINKSFSQTVGIIGPSPVYPGSQQTYSALFDYELDPLTNITWSVIGGTIISQNTDPESPSINCTIEWDDELETFGSITFTESIGGGFKRIKVFMNRLLDLCPIANAGSDATICQGNPVVIGTPAISGYNYSWSPTTGLSNPNIAQPTANPSQTTTYTLTMTPSFPNLLTNGNFEGSGGFLTDYGSFPNGNSSCTDPGPYGSVGITTNPHLLNTAWCNLIDHSPSGNKMLAVDGSCNTSHRFWYTTVPVTPNTTYYFSGWGSALTQVQQNLGIRINGVVIQNPLIEYCTANCNYWTFFSISWNSGSNSSALIELRSASNQPNGNDFCLDDLYFGKSGCQSTSDQVSICVCNAPPPSQTIVRNIPLGVPLQMYKWDPALGHSCLVPEGQFHGHYTYVNSCGSPILMSGSLEADNHLPAYQSVDLAFNMYPRNFGNGPVLYLPGYGSVPYDQFISPNDIIEAKLYLFHYNSLYPACNSEFYPLNEFTLNQAHSGNNSFTITRSNHAFDYNSCSAVNNAYPVNYDSPPQTYPSDVITVNGPGNSNNDYTFNVTQMVKNGVYNYANQFEVGFQIRQVQTSTYNNVLFQGQMFPLNTDDHPYPGEPYIQLTYVYRPPASGCNLTKQAKDDIQPLINNSNTLYDTLPALLKSSGEIKLFPNPTNSYISIISPDPMIAIELYDVRGSLLKQIHLKGERNLAISVVNLKSGYYFAKILTDKGLKPVKFVIQR